MTCASLMPPLSLYSMRASEICDEAIELAEQGGDLFGTPEAGPEDQLQAMIDALGQPGDPPGADDSASGPLSNVRRMDPSAN